MLYPQNRIDATPKTVVYVPNEVGGMTSHLQPLHQEPSISSTTDLVSLCHSVEALADTLPMAYLRPMRLHGVLQN